MQLVDIIILVFVILMTVWGMVRGIVRQVGDLAALLLGVICTYIWSKDLAILLFERTEWSLAVCQFVATLALFTTIYITLRIVVACIRSIAQKVRLGWIDSIAGGIFGAFKAILFASIVLNVAMFLTKDSDIWKSPTFTQTFCYEVVRDFAPQIFNIVEGKTTTPTP